MAYLRASLCISVIIIFELCIHPFVLGDETNLRDPDRKSKQLRGLQEMRKLPLFDHRKTVNDLSDKDAVDRSTRVQLDLISDNMGSFSSDQINNEITLTSTENQTVKHVVASETIEQAAQPVEFATDATTSANAITSTVTVPKMATAPSLSVKSNVPNNYEVLEKEKFFVELARRILDVKKQGLTKTSFIIHPINSPLPTYRPLPPMLTKAQVFRRIYDDSDLDKSVNNLNTPTDINEKVDSFNISDNLSTTEEVTTKITELPDQESSESIVQTDVEMHPHTTLLGSHHSLIEKLQPEPENEPIVSSLVNQLKEILNATVVIESITSDKSITKSVTEPSTNDIIEISTKVDPTTFETQPDETIGTTRSSTAAYVTPDFKTNAIHDEVTSFLKSVAFGSGFQGAFVGELVNNFNNLNNNAVKLLHNLLINPLKFSSPTTESSFLKESSFNIQDSHANNMNFTSHFQPSDPVINSNSVTKNTDENWMPYRSMSRSSRGGGTIEVITAPSVKKFQLVVGSSLHSEPRHSSSFQRRSGFPNMNGLRVGVGMPPPDALKALPPGAQLVLPSQLQRMPILPKITFNEDNIPVPVSNVRPSSSLPDKRTQNSPMSALSSLPNFIASFFSGRPVKRRNRTNPERNRNSQDDAHVRRHFSDRQKMPHFHRNADYNSLRPQPNEEVINLQAPGPIPVTKRPINEPYFTEQFSTTHESQPHFSAPIEDGYQEHYDSHIPVNGYHHDNHDSFTRENNSPITYFSDQRRHENVDNEYNGDSIDEESSHFAVRYHENGSSDDKFIDSEGFQSQNLGFQPLHDEHSRLQSDAHLTNGRDYETQDLEPIREENINENQHSDSNYYSHRSDSYQYDDYNPERHPEYDDDFADFDHEFKKNEGIENIGFTPIHVEPNSFDYDVPLVDHRNSAPNNDNFAVNEDQNISKQSSRILPQPTIVDNETLLNSSDYYEDYRYDRETNHDANVFKMEPIQYHEEVLTPNIDSLLQNELNKVISPETNTDNIGEVASDQENVNFESDEVFDDRSDYDHEFYENRDYELSDSEIESYQVSSEFPTTTSDDNIHINFGDKIKEHVPFDYASAADNIVDESIPRGQITQYAGAAPYDSSAAEVTHSVRQHDVKYDYAPEYYEYVYYDTQDALVNNEDGTDPSNSNEYLFDEYSTSENVKNLSNVPSMIFPETDNHAVIKEMASPSNSHVQSADQSRVFNHNLAKSHEEDTYQDDIYVNEPVQPIGALSKVNIDQMFTDDLQSLEQHSPKSKTFDQRRERPRQYRRPSLPSVGQNGNPDSSAAYLFNTIDLVPHSADSFNTRHIVDEHPSNSSEMMNGSYSNDEINFTVTNINEIVEDLAPADEYMAYVLIGSCVGLALLSITGVLLIIRFKKSCGSRQIRSRQRLQKGALPNVSSTPETFLESDVGGHKLGSWFTGKGGTFGSGKLRSNMALPDVEDLRRDQPERSSSRRDLLSMHSNSSGSASPQSLDANIHNDKKSEKSSESWLRRGFERNVESGDLKKEYRDITRHAVSNQIFDSKGRPVTSQDSEFLTNKSEGEFYTTDSEFYDPTTAGEDGDSSRYLEDSQDVDTLDQIRGMRSVTTSQELGEKLSHDIRHFQTRESPMTSRDSTVDKKQRRGHEDSNLRRTTSEASFTRDNVQNEVFLEFDNIFKQHGQYLSTSDGHQSSLDRASEGPADKRSNSPDSIETQKHAAPSSVGERRRISDHHGGAGIKHNHHHGSRHHRTRSTSVSSKKEHVGIIGVPSNKSPPTPPRFTPPPPPPRPPKPDRLSKTSSSGGDSSSKSPKKGNRDDRLV